MLAALFTDRFMQHTSGLKKHGKTLHIIAGGIMILMGVAMITGYLTVFSIWILKTFPWLGTLG
jgi:cytochrome c-type biogenesis protein